MVYLMQASVLIEWTATGGKRVPSLFHNSYVSLIFYTNEVLMSLRVYALYKQHRTVMYIAAILHVFMAAITFHVGF